jgi:hypothetical protein
MARRRARAHGSRMRLKSRSARVSPAVLVLVLAAVAAGAAASLLASAPRSVTPGTSHYAELLFPLWEIEATLVVLIFGGIALLLYSRVRAGSAPIPGRIAVSAVVTILVAILLLVVIQHAAFPNGPSGGGHGSSSSPGTGTTNATNGTTNSTQIPGSGSFLWLGPSAPPWTLFAIVAVLAVALSVGVTSPIWWRALAERGRSEPGVPSAASVAAIQVALTEATDALDAGADLRAVVIRLYAVILAKIGPTVGDLDGSTPEEIRAGHLVRLGIRPDAAEVLTRSFEEARYSTHLVTDATVARVTIALRDARADLERAA